MNFAPEEEPQYITQEKYKQILDELEYLRTTRRREIAEALEQAKSFGDISENAEYEEARTAQAQLEDRIASIQSILKRTVIIKGRRSDRVGLGSSVVVKKEGERGERRWQLVGSQEADISAGKISNQSPIGKAMLGKAKGDNFSVKTASGEANYKIVDIE